jgi:toxin YoeB
VILAFSSDAWADYLYWQETDPRMVKRINELLKDIVRSPFVGIGKPEPLKHEFAGHWSRRIDQRHRLICRATKDTISIMQCRLHY